MATAGFALPSTAPFYSLDPPPPCLGPPGTRLTEKPAKIIFLIKNCNKISVLLAKHNICSKLTTNKRFYFVVKTLTHQTEMKTKYFTKACNVCLKKNRLFSFLLQFHTSNLPTKKKEKKTSASGGCEARTSGRRWLAAGVTAAVGQRLRRRRLQLGG